MDPEGFPGALFRAWEPRISIPSHLHNPALAVQAAAAAANSVTGLVLNNPHAGMRGDPARSFEFGFTSGGAGPGTRAAAKNLEELFKDYGVRITTLAKMAEMGFTVQTLVNMTDEELEDVIKTMVDVYRVELLVGEKYGIKSAIRSERKHLDDEVERLKGKSQARGENKRRRVDDPTCVAPSRDPPRRESSIISMIPDSSGALNLNAVRDQMLITQQQQQQQLQLPAPAAAAAATPTAIVGDTGSDRRHTKKKQKRKRYGEDGEDRPREHPFIVTEPGELARGKKNGLDYLFDLYEQCGKYLEEVQQQCKERGEKCPTKVTNQVFRHAKHRGASYINKPKMRHYVHCYALHCLDPEQSNHLRKVFKDRGENVGAWRQACYYPLVEMARSLNWDIEGVFSRNDKLRIWYVPTRLRQLCHIEKSKEC